MILCENKWIVVKKRKGKFEANKQNTCEMDLCLLRFALKRKKIYKWNPSTLLKGEKVHFQANYFFIGTYLQLFQRIQNQHQILHLLKPISKLVVICQLRNQTSSKLLKKWNNLFFKHVSNKLYFLILILDQQVVKIVSPYWAPCYSKGPVLPLGILVLYYP